MTNGLNRLYWGIVLTISTIPLLAAIYGGNKYYYWGGIILFITIFSLGFIIFFCIHFFKILLKPLGLFEQDEEAEKNKKLYGDYFPRYNKKLALSLAMASKIAYEDAPVIKYELEKAGYDMNSFKPIAYKNVCGYIVEKDDNIIL